MEPQHRPPHRDAVPRATLNRRGRDIERRGDAPHGFRVACRISEEFVADPRFARHPITTVGIPSIAIEPSDTSH
jgi:hypothetical protein